MAARMTAGIPGDRFTLRLTAHARCEEELGLLRQRCEALEEELRDARRWFAVFVARAGGAAVISWAELRALRGRRLVRAPTTEDIGVAWRLEDDAV